MKRRIAQLIVAALIATTGFVPFGEVAGAEPLACGDIDGATVEYVEAADSRGTGYAIRWYFDRVTYDPVACNGKTLTAQVERWASPTKKKRAPVVTEEQAEATASAPDLGAPVTVLFPDITSTAIETAVGPALGHHYVDTFIQAYDTASTEKEVCIVASTTAGTTYPDGEGTSIGVPGFNYSGALRACLPRSSGGGSNWI